MESVYPIHYRFLMRDGTRVEFHIRLDPKTLALADPLPVDAPRWAQLSYERCPTCTLDPATHALCPAAGHLVGPVAGFSKTLSFTEARVEVETPERTMAKDTTVQTGLSSLLGIYMSSSGCPVLAKLRPMVRFHLPFATPLETTFRSVSTYLLGQLVRRSEGFEPDWKLEGLTETYRETGEVNRAFAKRLRVAGEIDASINALILLDIFAKTVPGSIEDQLREVRTLFTAWG
jgi:hypothetical protein